eukprot:CAMPEP_0196586466 /NCGR_PEP_ID=MMETSP1081-20130531/54380_1 /TAXON_ID=36882 /ORGANISM="Pyramimonas amylifera, Strain CCMP720" /LENGTH=478 /DNA_ID=CAMNT_0041908363 /DNA_START=97 /DNA_END=1533 /DNA_ORIENTATION=-
MIAAIYSVDLSLLEGKTPVGISLRVKRAPFLKPRTYRQARRMASGRLCVSASEQYFMGIDFGTSGARATVIDEDRSTLAESRRSYEAHDGDSSLADSWERALFGLLEDVPSELRSHIASIAIDGTSATAMLVQESSGEVLAGPLMYDHACTDALPQVKELAPSGHTVTSATSTLCKLVHWDMEGVIPSCGDARLMHQADWLAFLLTDVSGVTDYNNALKLGYDPAPEVDAFPAWMSHQSFSQVLPTKVVAPGTPYAPVSAPVCIRTGVPAGCQVCGGTTDSIAAFLAAGLSEPGQAVTSLGSTMALKLISTRRVDQAATGIYSHRMEDLWLVGGASNTGGAVLRGLFTDKQLKELSEQIDPNTDSGLDYYPLTKPGERFPVNDPDLQPRLTPRPERDVDFLHGILESVARIEALAFENLAKEGASKLNEVHTAGGGASNDTWIQMRSRILGVPVRASSNVEASYGAALLARKGISGKL